MEMLIDSNLRLRPIQLPNDLVIALPWYQDEEVLLFSEGTDTSPYNLTTIERMYKYLIKKGEVYIIELNQSQKWIPIGDVMLSKEMIPIVIGIKEHRGRGIGKRVIKLLIQRAKSLNWAQLRVNKVYYYNISSIKLFESLGFKIIRTDFDDNGRKYYSYEFVIG